MATTINFSISLADFLATAVSDATNAAIVNVTKIDATATPASQIDEFGGELWANLIDGMFLATYQQLYSGTKMWSVANAAARDGLGSDDALAVNDLLFKTDDQTLWFCTAVTGGGTSTWSTVAALGDMTGPAGATDEAISRYDGATGKLVQDSVVLVSDAGNLSGIANLTLSGLVDGRDVAVDGATLDAHVADIANPHITSLTKALVAGNLTSGNDIEISVGDALIGNENAAVPGGAPAAGKGTIWVKDDAPTTLQFTDDTGVDHDLTAASAGGDVVGPAVSTDNAIARYDLATGKLIQNSAVTIDDAANITTGGSIFVTGNVDGRDVSTDGATLDAHVADLANPHVTTLALALASGASTGGTSLTVTAADTVIFANTTTTLDDSTGTFTMATADAQGIVIDSTGGGPITLTPGGALELDYATFPAADGTATFVLATNGAGVLSWVANGGGGEDLAATLVLGNITGGTDVIVSAGDAFMLIENAAVPTAPAATQGVIWVKNAAPNELWFTNDAGTDVQLGIGGSAETLAATLVAGNMTAGTDLEVSAGDAILGNENATVPGGAPGAAKGTWWIKNDAPNTPFFTDDAGTDHNLLLPEGTAGGDLNGSYPNPLVDDGADGTAIHDNVAGEIAAIAVKASPVAGDFLVIEDSAAGNIKKHVTLGTLPAGAAESLATTLAAGNSTGGTDIGIQHGDEIVGITAGGAVVLRGGPRTTAGNAGSALLAGGTSSGTGTGAGATLVYGGTAAANNAGGGRIEITGGASHGTGSAGAVAILGGQSNTGVGANPGAASLTGGTALATASDGGDASVTGGTPGITADGGDVLITSGRGGSTSGNSGDVTIGPGTVTSGTVGTVAVNGLKTSVNRIQHGQGTALVAGDFALHANWGTTASVSAITGTDSRFVITILSTGTGQAAAPTITFTYKDGAWPNAPFPMITDNGSVSAGGNYINPCFELTSRTTTTAVWTLRNGSGVARTAYTPVATDTFQMIVHVMG